MDISGIEAAIWVWKHLWKKDSNHLKFDILDAVIRDGPKVEGWIFTATDGSVKSKANFRWNDANIIERCTKDDMKTISGHEYVQRTWKALNLNDFHFAHDMSPAIVLMGRINNPSFFIEQSYTFEPGDMQARQVTNRLCPDTIKGTGTLPLIGAVPTSDDLPTHRLRNKDKKLSKLAEDKMKEFVQLIENKYRLTTKKMIAVYLVEVVRNGAEASGSNMRLWLHHVCALNVEKKSGTMDDNGSTVKGGSIRGGSIRGGGGGWDVRSETSATVAPTSVSGHLRGGTMRCAGDFCGFVEEEEAVLRATDEGSLSEQAQEAIRRHRRPTEEEADENGASMLARMDRDLAEEKANLHKEFGSGVLIGSQAFKVPQKTIVLVRNDMQKLEQLGGDDVLDPTLSEQAPWPDLVQHWWWRVGKSIMDGKSKRVVIPESSGHQICSSIWGEDSGDKSALNDNSKEGITMDPRARLARIADGLNQSSVVSSAGCVGGTGKLTAENLNILDQNDGGDLKGHRKRSDFAKPLGSKDKNGKIGDLSWYYSEANVCERCYHVYRDIERKRKLIVREKAVKSIVNPYDTMYTSLPQQAQEALRGVPLTERDRYLEARKQNFIRRQKSSADRLAQSNKIADSIFEEDSAYATNISSLGGGPYESTTSDYHRKKYTSPAGAPKGVIPPAPWNLTDESVRSEYAAMGSAFIKNIGNKAKTMSMHIKEDENLREWERQMGIDNNTEIDDKFKWKAMTGQAKGNRYISKLSREDEIGPNPLHKSSSAGDVLRNKRKERDRREVKVVSKPFDSSRLMHKWQRDMEAERIQRRQEDEIWKDDIELNNRLQSYQNTEIVKSVIPVKKSKKNGSKRAPTFQAPTVAPNHVLNQKVIDTANATMDQIFRQAMTLGDAELGITRKNSLHTIDEADDDDGDRSPPLCKTEPSLTRAAVNNQYGSPKPIGTIKPTYFSKPPLSVGTVQSGVGSDSDDEDDGEDEGIGWSPFVVPLE